MDDKQFKECMDLKGTIKSKKDELRGQKKLLRQIERERTDIISELQEGLTTKKASYLSTTEKINEFDKKYDTSNANQRQQKITKLTLERSEYIKYFRESSQNLVDYINDSIDELKEELSDLRLEMQIKLEYYKPDMTIVAKMSDESLRRGILKELSELDKSGSVIKGE